MTWFLVSDDQWTKFEVTNTSARAQALWMRAGSYCGQQLTDGNVSRREVTILKGTLAAANELVDHGYWDRTSTGFVFKDWASSQQTRAKVEAKRARWRREKSGTCADIPARIPRAPIPVPIPSPISSVNQVGETETSVPALKPVAATTPSSPAGRASRKIFEATTVHWEPVATKWRAALVELGGKPDSEWAIASAVLRDEALKPKLARGVLNPDHILGHWSSHYAVGQAPGGRDKLAANDTAPRYRELAAAGGER